jgi:hypothetical protein
LELSEEIALFQERRKTTESDSVDEADIDKSLAEGECSKAKQRTTGFCPWVSVLVFGLVFSLLFRLTTCFFKEVD